MITKKKRSQKQESNVAKTFNARTTVASGAKWAMKGDVRSDRYLIECKTTNEDSYRVTSKVWEKIQDEALKDKMRIPLLIVDLEDTERFVIFRPKDFPDELFKFSYDATSNGDNKKSYLLQKGTLEECFEESGINVLGGLFLICGVRRNMLMYMREKDFLNKIDKELS